MPEWSRSTWTQPSVSRSTRTVKIPTSPSEGKWRIVPIPITTTAHFYLDNLFGDKCSGLFAVLDGHGGTEVVEYVTKVLPEVSSNAHTRCSWKSLNNGTHSNHSHTSSTCSRKSMISYVWWGPARSGQHAASHSSTYGPSTLPTWGTRELSLPRTIKGFAWPLIIRALMKMNRCGYVNKGVLYYAIV
jgi:hypothetical protein